MTLELSSPWKERLDILDPSGRTGRTHSWHHWDHWSNCPCKMRNPKQLRIRPWSCSCCDCQNLQSETLGDSALDTARQLPIAFNLITGSLRWVPREAFVMWLYWHRKHNVQHSLDTRLENHCDADASSSCSWNDPKLSSPWISWLSVVLLESSRVLSLDTSPAPKLPSGKLT